MCIDIVIKKPSKGGKGQMSPWIWLLILAAFRSVSLGKAAFGLLHKMHTLFRFGCNAVSSGVARFIHMCYSGLFHWLWGNHVIAPCLRASEATMKNMGKLDQYDATTNENITTRNKKMYHASIYSSVHNSDLSGSILHNKAITPGVEFLKCLGSGSKYLPAGINHNSFTHRCLLIYQGKQQEQWNIPDITLLEFMCPQLSGVHYEHVI